MDKSTSIVKVDDPVAPRSDAQVRRRSRTAPATTVRENGAPDAEKEVQLSSVANLDHWPIPSWAVIAVALLLCLAFLSRSDLSSWTETLKITSPFGNTASDSSFDNQRNLELSTFERLDIPLNPQNHSFRQRSVLELDWVVTAGYRRPDGVLKRVYLVNNEFPGPHIEARSGDTLRISVRNDLDKDEDIAIHWHGLHMRNANDMDGAVGYTQCPIRPGGHFTYEFEISDDQHGTFWYHAHDQVQRADGLFGGMIVHQPAAAEETGSPPWIPDYSEERLFLIGDWYHQPANSVLKWYMRAGSFGNEPVPDSLIVNYGGAYNCSDAARARPVDCVQTPFRSLPRLDITPGTAYRFRVVNTGTLAGFTLHFPGASLVPFEVDGGNPIDNSGSVESIGILYPGERVDFVASWTQRADATEASFEVELDEENFRYPNPALSTTHQFPISFEGQLVPKSPPKAKDPETNFSLVSAKSSKMERGFGSPKLANVTFVVYATTKKLARLSNVPYGFMNHTSWKPQDSPLLTVPRSQWDKNQLVPYIKSSPQDPVWVDLVINNLDDGSHPFHLHGYDFWVLSIHNGGKSYWGSYNPFDEPPDGPPGGPYNLVDPVKKDTIFVPRRGYAVLRFLADNEGIWMFHCHILWHQASGMAMGFQVGRDDTNGKAMDSLNVSNYDQLRQTCNE